MYKVESRKKYLLKLFPGIILFLLATGVIFFDFFSQSNLAVPQIIIAIAETVLNFLLFNLFILNLYFAIRRHALENLWLALGFFSFLLQNILRLYFTAQLNPANSIQNYHLFSFSFGISLFVICFFIASFSRGRFISVENRKRKYLLFLSGGLMFQALAIAVFYHWIRRYFNFAFHNFYIHHFIAFLGISLSIFLVIKFALSYFKNKVENSGIFLIAALFFAAAFGFIFWGKIDKITYLYSQFEIVAGLMVLAWAFFLEKNEYLQEEQELRYRIEQQYVEKENELQLWRDRTKMPGIGFFEMDIQGSLNFVNKTIVRWLRESDKKLLGKNLLNFLHEEDRDKVQTEILHSNEPIVRLDLKLKKKSGKLILVKLIANKIAQGWRCAVFENEKDLLQREQLQDYAATLEAEVEGRTRDLRERQDELEKVRRFYETLLGAMTDIVMVVNRKGNCTYINPYGKNLLGYEAKQLTGKRLPNFFEDVNKLQKNYGDSVQMELRDYEAPIKTRFGKKLLINWNVRYLFDENGKNIGAMCLGRKIDEKKRAERLAAGQKDFLQSVIAERTRQLEQQVLQLSEILTFDERLSSFASPEKFLGEACQTIRRLGWQQVVFSVKEKGTQKFKISGYAGVSKNNIRDFVRRRPFLFQGAETLLSEKSKISESYIIDFDENKRIFTLSKNGNSWTDSMALVFPVKIKNQLFGFVAAFQPKEKVVPDEQFVKLLETCAKKAALGYNNFNLLQNAQQRLREVDKTTRFKSDFFNVTAHELRTPLNSIISLTDVLLSELAGELNAAHKKQLKIIRQNGDELLKLIDNLLDLAKSDSGRLTIHDHYFSVEEIVDRISKWISPLCQYKNLEFVIKLNKNLPKFLFSDGEKIERIILNLLSNAVKYTSHGKIVWGIGFNKGKKILQILVQDSGIGMSEDEIKKIFAAYSRVDSFQKSKISGTGLGLAITKRFVDLLGGKIEVQSKQGKGTIFHVKIPVKHFSDSMASVKSAKNGKAQHASEKKTTKDQNASTILIVDDNPDNQYAVDYILSSRGYRPFFATDGKQGIKMAQKIKPDVILMDMFMPKMDGYEATKKIRAMKNLSQVVIIAMTAKTRQEDEDKALKSGCNDYLPKPFTTEQVIETIEKWIRKKNG